MFWNYHEWTNAFFVQLFAIAIALLYGLKYKVSKTNIFLAISLVSPVALFSVSAGVAGAIFLSDFFSLSLLLSKNKPKKWSILVGLAFVTYLVWPILSTLLAAMFSQTGKQISIFDSKVQIIQFLRYSLFFTHLAVLEKRPFECVADLNSIFKIQSIVIFIVFTALLLGYLEILEIDAWNELVEVDFLYSSLGAGGMFLYRGGVGTFSTLCVGVVFLCFVQAKGLYRYVMLLLIFIILLVVLFSGSRQGILFTFLVLFLSILLFYNARGTSELMLFALMISFFIFQVESVGDTVEWVLNRYELLISKNTSLVNEVNERNSGIIELEELDRSFFSCMHGLGLGGKTNLSESDYYNTYLYFGYIGCFFYFVFILYALTNIARKWLKSNEKTIRKILLAIMIVSFIMPLYGLQQWYLMSYTSNNTINVYFTLFLMSVSINKLEQTKKSATN